MDDLIVALAVYAAICGLVAWFGESRGYDPVTWFGFALLGTPLLAFLVALFKGERG